ncbi:hypothetical protein BDR07DRAFT_781907 [Suillus spraguei]|nr:hypothetical protein BDR07DRAFT_781907 [Suillus spraguei]
MLSSKLVVDGGWKKAELQKLKLTNQIWPSRYLSWHPPSIGTILGCGALTIPHHRNKDDPTDLKTAELKRGAKDSNIGNNPPHMDTTLREDNKRNKPPKRNTDQEMDGGNQ